MPFPMKIQPIDAHTTRESFENNFVKPVLKSRLRRLFDRQFPSGLRISSAEKPTVGEPQYNKDFGSELEPSSVCLAKMVQNFIEENTEKPLAAKCGRNRCNCFNGNNDSSDDEFDIFGGFSDSIPAASCADTYDILKSLIPCSSTAERSLLADTAKIIEKHKNCKRKDDLREFVSNALSILGYDASICKSRWEKCPSFPAGEYDFIDAIVDGERLFIDIDFRSEFEIARSTGAYKSILQSLPFIFVGKSDRLQQIVSIVSEAARQSLKKKGMHLPPWRKYEYMRAKWLSPHTRVIKPDNSEIETKAKSDIFPATSKSISGEFVLIFGEKKASSPESDFSATVSTPSGKSEGDEMLKAAAPVMWQPPAIEPKSSERGVKIVTGLASLLKERS